MNTVKALLCLGHALQWTLRFFHLKSSLYPWHTFQCGWSVW
jgi:hypothetical protein